MKKLNEEFLLKKIPLKSLNPKIVSEDLGNFYASMASNPYAPLDIGGLGQNTGVNLKLSTTTNGHTIEIKQGDSSFNVANEKFVLLTKNYLTAIITDLEKLKKMYLDQERKLSRLSAKIETLSNKKSRSDDFRSVIPPGAFKDGGN